MPHPISHELITRSEIPLNQESPFSALGAELTPNDRFFIRNHFPTPGFDPRTWQLRVEGAMQRPFSLSIDELESMPARTESAVIECSGNSRLFLDGRPESLQWELGGVGCATWTGVPLADVLARAEVNREAVDVVFEGADRGPAEKPNKPTTEIPFARSVPLITAMRPDVLLAYAMNGEPLSAEHGAPLRVIVPGWYGVTSVKWLSRIVVLERPFTGYFQSVEYMYWDVSDAQSPQRIPVSTLRVKSEIARPALGEKVALGEDYRIFGAAWTSDAIVIRVDVSSDSGATWHEAALGEPAKGHAWQHWSFRWKPEQRGTHVIMSRATDSRGRVQPPKHDENHENYMVHHTLPIRVTVV